jgi:hypothetical protein
MTETLSQIVADEQYYTRTTTENTVKIIVKTVEKIIICLFISKNYSRKKGEHVECGNIQEILMTKDISTDLLTNFMPPSKTSKIRPSIITLKTWNTMTILYGELPRNSKEQRLQYLH